MLSRATVRLAAEDRAALEEELGQAVELYWMLALDATLAGDGQGAKIYVDLAHRYGRALARVRGGLGLMEASAETRPRNVISESLDIPSAEFADDGKTPVEGEPRRLGPVDAVLDVRVTGTSSFAYRKV